MKPRERFLTAINHQEPDRVPVFITLTPQVAEKLGKKMGLPYEPEDSWVTARISHIEILLELGNDAVGIGPCRDARKPTIKLPDGRLQDEWGFIYQRASFYDEIVERPLSHIETVADLNDYAFPEALAPGRFDLAEKMTARYKDEYAIVGDVETTVFELSWNLVGMEKFIIDLMQEKEYIPALLDKVEAFHTQIALKLVEIGADVIWMGDDFGTQRGMLMSPDLYRSVFKPRHKRFIQAIKAANPDVKIAYHCCGSIVPIIEDLIEIGVDILNSIQPQAVGMNLAVLKQKYGDVLSFFGGLDVQGTLPYGTPQDVELEVKEKIRAAGKGGGYILAGAHNIQPDTSLENIYAIYNAVKKYGTYPLKLD